MQYQVGHKFARKFWKFRPKRVHKIDSRSFLQDFDMNMSDYDGRTALHLSCAEGHLDVIQVPELCTQLQKTIESILSTPNKKFLVKNPLNIIFFQN
jgi:hypothetical protein